MGHSLYDKIYLGRSMAPSRRKWLQIAVVCAASLGVAALVLEMMR